MKEDIENMEPNRSPELAELIRDNIDFQQNQNIKKTLFKESMVKVSLDKDFKDLFQAHSDHDASEDSSAANFIEVTSEIKEICSWLEESNDFRGMAYIPYGSVPKLLHILHQKVENTVLVVAEYQEHWLQKMEEMARLYKIKWGFINLTQTKEDKIKVLELYEMHKIKLLFVSPSIFKHEEYLEFQSDVLILPDLHLYLKAPHFLDQIIGKCNPGRVLTLYSSLMREPYQRALSNLTPINEPVSEDRTCICLKTTAEEKYKTFLSYQHKNQMKRTLVVVKDKQEAAALSRKLKLMSLTSYNMFEALTCQQISQFTAPQILYRTANDEDKVMKAVRKSKNYSITISRYFDALRFAHFDCILYFSFTDVPKFVEYCPDTTHRIALLVCDDYYKLRNEITSEYIGAESLVRIVMKIMEKGKKKQQNSLKRFYSDCVDDKLFDCYSVSKEYAGKDEEKVIRINWFCKTYDISYKNFKKVVDALCKHGILTRECKLVYEIEVQEESLPTFRKLFPQGVEVRRRVNLLSLSTSAQKTTRALLEEMKQGGIEFKVTEKALQLNVKKCYEEVNWNSLRELVNAETTEAAKDLDKSYYLFKEYSYGSVELTRRQKSLERKKHILNFYNFSIQKQANLFDSTHKSNLLTSEIEEWVRHTNEGQLDEHQLVLLLQGVEVGNIVRFKEDPIFGRYRRVKYEDLFHVVSKIYRNKRVKK